MFDIAIQEHNWIGVAVSSDDGGGSLIQQWSFSKLRTSLDTIGFWTADHRLIELVMFAGSTESFGAPDDLSYQNAEFLSLNETRRFA